MNNIVNLSVPIYRASMASCIEKSLVKKAQPLADMLKSNGLTVVTAESCTGGLIAAVLSQAEGASDFLHGGFVTYTKEHKACALNVSYTLMEKKGCVNEEVAHQMVTGALTHSPADLALAVTGVLGPDEDEDGNPVGLFFMAVMQRNSQPKIVRYNLADIPVEQRLENIIDEAIMLLEKEATDISQSIQSSAIAASQ